MDSVSFEKIDFPSSYNMEGSFGQEEYALFHDPSTVTGMIGTLAQAIGNSIQASRASDFYSKVLKKADIDLGPDFREQLKQDLQKFNVVKKIRDSANYILEIKFYNVGLYMNRVLMKVTVTSTKVKNGVAEESHATFNGEKRFKLSEIARDPEPLRSEIELGYKVLSSQIIKGMKGFNFEESSEH